MKHVMVDLETMGTGPDAAIIQIGACRFDPAKPESTCIGVVGFEQAVSLQSSIFWGGSTDKETQEWWRTKADETARASVCKDPIQIGVALMRFSQWLDQGEEYETIWSHGAAFDIPILDGAYRRLGLKAPWSYRKVRDTRTVFGLAKGRGWTPRPGQTAHTALADAKAQVLDLRLALQVLGWPNPVNPVL